VTAKDVVETRVRTWLEEVVIGLTLCPFAAAPWKGGEVRIAVSEVEDPEEAVRVALDEALALLHPGDDEGEAVRPRTTLVCYSRTLSDFETFLDAAATLEHILSEAGAEGMLQVATFHPDYRFEGEAADSVSHWTNRSPVPILHLLLESDVSDAVDRHPDAEAIPEENIARLEALGIGALRDLWARFSAAPDRDAT
jgi:hypothetical protein